ncbi:uncharacterized protein [Palaemon carinicauda]|uniref:uncharacterized protein isoform X2 n=1 Tax=Palaemon carinicauda TaxID=392227 RepID=UPI0035B5D8E1
MAAPPKPWERGPGSRFMAPGVYPTGEPNVILNQRQSPFHPGLGFIQVAEDSSRQAFQSIESIVHAFGTVSMMLESTYHAVYSSFRAVLGVAEHFSRMKSHFAQIFSALAVVRTLKWIMKKLLYIIGLRSQDPSLEAAWRNAASSATSSLTEADLKQSRSSWPIVMFFAVVCGGPYLIWHVLSSLVASDATQKTQGWRKGISEHYAAVALYSFQAGSRKELSFQTGQSLFLAPKDLQPQVRGWLLASNGNEMGLVPANYIKILGLKKRSAPQGSANSSSVIRARVAPGIPSVPVLKKGEQKSSSPGPAKNSEPVVKKKSSSDVPPSCRTDVVKQASLLDSDIPWQPDVGKKILSPEASSVQNMGGQETPTNMEGPGRPAVSGKEVDGQSASPNLDLTEKSSETAKSRLTLDNREEMMRREDSTDKETFEQDIRNDTPSSSSSFGEIQCGTSSTVNQLVPTSDNTESDSSSQSDVEGERESVCVDKTEVCVPILDEKKSETNGK